MARDLRQFLNLARKQGPDYFLEVKKPLNVDLEVSVIQEKLAKQGRYPIVYVPKMNGFKPPYCCNLFASYELLGLGLDLDREAIGRLGKGEVLQEYRRRLKDPKPLSWVDGAEAPVKQIIMKGDEVDLFKLPIPKNAALDSGRYITIGHTILREPDHGVYNMGCYRHEIKEKNKLGCMIAPVNHGSYVGRRYEELGMKMPFVLMIGHHPALTFASGSRGPLDMNELELAGGFLGEPLRVAKGETVDLPVPAEAEIAIEGWIDPANPGVDGPFGEYSGYYGDPNRRCYIMNVTAITMREDAIYHGLDPAHREHNMSCALAIEASIWDVVARRIPPPFLKAVHAPPSGCGVYHIYLSIKKRNQGEGKLAGLLAVSAEMNGKVAFVVDEDVDAYDEQQVLWAMATRMTGDKDIAVIPGVTQGILDPRAYGEKGYERGEMIAKVIIDCTRPVTLPYAERILPPAELWESMDLEEYI